MPIAQYDLRPYQERGVALAVASVAPASRLMLGAATGTGKSFIALSIQDAVPGAVILTISNEIIRGFKDKNPDCEVYTYVKYRNMLMNGHDLPPLIICDEAHTVTEVTSVTMGDILAIAPEVSAVALTATVFRGTPAGTDQLRETWGTPEILISIKDAVRQGFWQMPELKVVGLLDDDELKVVNGQFQISSIQDGTLSRMESLIECIRREKCGPTVVSLPNTECVRMVEMVMGDEVCSIIQDTKTADRTKAYESCRTGEKVLLQIKAITTGVDLPWLQTLIDAHPTLSPVMFLQHFGRLTRPFPCAKKYVCTNRSLERHAYLLDGMAPMSIIAESQEAFGGFSERSTTKTVGLEAAGKFKIIPVPLDNGVTAGMYALQTLTEDRKQKEFVILCLPNHAKPIVFSRLNGKAKFVNGMPQRSWGRWRTENRLPDDFCGYKTKASGGELSDKQKAWWERSAAHRGLDPSVANDITRREFGILPVLMDCKLSLKALL